MQIPTQSSFKNDGGILDANTKIQHLVSFLSVYGCVLLEWVYYQKLSTIAMMCALL